MKKILVWIVALISLTSLSVVSAQTYNCPGFGMMGGYGYSGVGLIFGWLFMALVLIALVLFIIWLIKQIQSNNKGRKN